MLTRDYIMRMIDTLIRVLEKIFFLKEAKNYPEALKELDSLTKELLGMDSMFIHSLSDSQLVQIVDREGNLLAPKCYLIGVVFKEEAEIFMLQGNRKGAAKFYMRSLNMFIAGIENSGITVEKDHLKKIDDVIDKLSEYELPPDISGKLFFYYEFTGRFDKAEDILFNLIDVDNAYLDRGIGFFKRLLQKSDKELAAGNLPRNEVEEGLADLMNMKN